MKSKKGQEEMVGFVVIVVLVAVIGLVMLGLVLRQKPAESSSPEVYQLLESMMETTVNCSLETQQVARVRDMFEPCLRGDLCSNDGRDSCLVLNETVGTLLTNVLYKGNQSNVKYVFNSKFISNSSSSGFVLARKEGNCSSNSIGSLYPLPADRGRIDVMLELC